MGRRARRTISFQYKTGAGFLYKVPAALKIVMILLFSAAGLLLPLEVLPVFIVLALILAFFHKFSVQEQFADIKPALYYFVFLYVMQFFTARRSFIPEKSLAEDILRLFLIMQVSGLLFRTTSSAAMKEGLETLEIKIRAFLRRIPLLGRKIKAKPFFAVIFALFLSFIPAIFEIWGRIELAWAARGGKNGFKKLKTLLPVLFCLSFNEASKKTRALAARRII